MKWDVVWLYVVGAAIVSYFGLGIVLTIGGFFDVFKMFRRLEAERNEHLNLNNGDTFPKARPTDRPAE
ncbi:MAG: hypothetical protein AMXMBFR13_42340 [Phycisphaerae bacterium]